MSHLPRFALTFLLTAGAPLLFAHEEFLPLHEAHLDPDHGHTHFHLHAPAHTAGKVHAPAEQRMHADHRFAFASGFRYTHYSLDDERAELWEAAAGFDFAVLPWLHLGGEWAHGWFDSAAAGSAEGWMRPRAHVDLHLPLGSGWEATGGIEIGFPGGEAALVGDHWEWTPHVELRHDRGRWFVEAGAALIIIAGTGDEHDHASHADSELHQGDEHADAEEEEHDAEEEEHAHASHAHAPGDFHDTIEPHADRELNYHAAAGVRLLDCRWTLEGRFSGTRILSGESPSRDYLRAGVRTALRIGENITLSAGSSLPITDARRNEWQAHLGLGISF